MGITIWKYRQGCGFTRNPRFRCTPDRLCGKCRLIVKALEEQEEEYKEDSPLA